jgi:choline-sulfatase
VPSVDGPVYFMTDDEISRGSNPQNLFGAFYVPVIQPNHVETVVTKIDGVVWKYSRYFDNPQFWSSPGVPGEPGVMDVLLHEETPLVANPPAGVHEIRCTRTVKYEPAPDEYELYNVTEDPMELDNLAGNPSAAVIEARLAGVLANQRAEKRLYPVSGPVPGQIGPSATRAVPLPTSTPTTCAPNPAPPTPQPLPAVDPDPVTAPAPAAPGPAAALPVVATPTFTG